MTGVARMWRYRAGCCRLPHMPLATRQDPAMYRLWLFVVLIFVGVLPAAANERVPAYVIRVPAAIKTVFVAETLAAKFHQFDNESGSPIEYRGSTYMSIGKSGDGKRRNGDRRTPLGIYFVTEQLDTSRLHEKYGITAFVLDYPNVLDRRRQYTGDGIWVHGVDRRGGKRPPRDTDGCIALPNESLAMLEDRFAANRTPVIVTRRLEWVDRDTLDTIGRELETAVAEWAESQRQGDLHTFLSLYHDDFRHWGMNTQEWLAFQAETLNSRRLIEVTVSDLLLLADPVEAGTYLSRFTLRTVEDGRTTELTRRLYWRRAAGG
ncbi:MAG: L,D-transpeptidase family protein, partial [Woeseiaceae bacterium]|nr:L,D-transpeptidase family protein [Woeseiaceae bacterium]